jgi:hypothetical protein
MHAAGVQVGIATTLKEPIGLKALERESGWLRPEVVG